MLHTICKPSQIDSDWVRKINAFDRRTDIKTHRQTDRQTADCVDRWQGVDVMIRQPGRSWWQIVAACCKFSLTASIYVFSTCLYRFHFLRFSLFHFLINIFTYKPATYAYTYVHMVTVMKYLADTINYRYAVCSIDFSFFCFCFFFVSIFS